MSILAKTTFVAGLAASLMAGSAMAQDWGGGYIGLSAGVAFDGNDGQSVVFDTNLDGTFNDTVNTTTPANAFSPGFCDGRPATTAPTGGCNGSDVDLDIGVRGGYDRNMGGLIVGVVGDISFPASEDRVTAFSITPANYAFSREVDWMASIRARVGAPVGSYLVYGTAGLAKAKIDHAFTTTNGVNTFTVNDDDKSHGYQLGGGVERHWNDSWVLGVEYLFTSLDDGDYSVRSGPPAPGGNAFTLVNAAGTDLKPSDEDFEIHTLKFTLNRKF